MSNELLTVTEERDALLALLEKTVPALIRLGDFVGNIDEGGASGVGRIDRCDLILKVRNTINRERNAMTTPQQPQALDSLIEIYEVWAGSEGIPEPQTACEAYLLRLIEQMRNIARAAIAKAED